MLATSGFTMRITPQEKKMLISVSQHFRRSKSDTLKTLVRIAYENMQAEKIEEPKPASRELSAAL